MFGTETNVLNVGLAIVPTWLVMRTHEPVETASQSRNNSINADTIAPEIEKASQTS